MYSHQTAHKLCICLCVRISTWVNVKLTLHSLGNALQFDSLQGAVGVNGGWQAAQSLPDEAGHLSHCKNLQQLTINCRKCPQEHRLGRIGQCSITWTPNKPIIVKINSPQRLESLSSYPTAKSCKLHCTSVVQYFRK